MLSGQPAMPDFIHVDIESRSPVDLKQHGLDRYSAHSETEIISAAWTVNDGRMQLWNIDDSPHPPSELKEAFEDEEVEFRAFNCTFERVMLSRRLGWRNRYKNMRCTMALANMFSFTGSLDQIGVQIGLPDEYRKNDEGTRLIKKFCMPQKLTKTNELTWRDSLTDPEDWNTFVNIYNPQDVVAETAMWKRLIKFPTLAEEWELYELDQKINDRGFPMDETFVQHAMQMAARRKAELVEAMREITGLDNPNSPTQFTAWLKERGYPFSDLKKDTVKKVLAEHEEYVKTNTEFDGDEFDPRQTYDGIVERDAHAALRLRQWAARTSTRKYTTVQKRVGEDWNYRYGIQYGGAARTLRFSGRGFQVHNLPRPPKSIEPDKKLGIELGVSSDYVLNHVTQLIRSGDYEALSMYMEEPMEGLVGTLRSSIAVHNDDEEFCVADLSSIETCVSAWVTGCTRLLGVLRDKKDPYIDFGTFMFSTTYDQVTKFQRQQAKPAVLGCPRGDTPVLTHRGWVRIDQIEPTDLICDGENFVPHGGLINQGERDCVIVSGVFITPEHEIESGYDQWVRSENCDDRYLRQALASARSRLSDISKTENLSDRSILSAVIADKNSNEGGNVLLEKARQKAVSSATAGLLAKLAGSSGPSFSTNLLTVSTRSGLAAEIQKPRTSWTTAVVESSVGSLMPTPLFHSSLKLLARMDRLRSTASTMTATTSREIFGLVTGRFRTAIDETALGSSIEGLSTVQPSSGAYLLPYIETQEQSFESGSRERPLLKSFQTKRSAGVHTTYDILNVGPNRRFVILSEDGPIVIHNCCYRLGGGELRDGKRTGLWGYAESMGVDLKREDCHKAVNIYRTNYPEIPLAWYALEKAVIQTIRSGRRTIPQYRRADGSVVNMPLRIEYLKPFLIIWLPSGGPRFYHLPRVSWQTRYTRDGDPYEKETISFMGQNQISKKWGRIESHGGKFFENIVQGIAREILKKGMLRADKAGFDLRAHVHDELVALIKRGDNYFTHHFLAELMAKENDWCPDLPLGAEGYVAPFYRK